MTQPATADAPTGRPDPSSSVAATFLDTARRRAGAEAFRSPTADGSWSSLTWARTAERARELGAGFLALGIGVEDRVAIACATRIEWVLADLGVLVAGGATTTVYPNTRPEDVAFILADSGSVVVVAEDAVQLEKVQAHRADLPAVRHVVLVDPAGIDVAGSDGFLLTLDDLAERGRELLATTPSAVDDRVAQLTPQHLATLIYTSGTTGKPKGVELTHDNWLYIGEATEAIRVLHEDHLQFLWLPLSHVFAKLLVAAQVRVGFATAIDGRIDKIVENLAVIKPTFMAAAPRIFEKVHARVNSTAKAEGGAKAKIFDWAFGVGLECVRHEQAGRGVPTLLGLQRAVADKLVFTKIRERLGGRLEVLVSGSAALAPQIAEWFAAAGMPICEGYGMTECGGAAFVNRPGKVRIGTVGQALPGTEVKIADDGEILLRSRGVMRGYHHLPEQSAEMLVEDGWLATGDVGELDADGFLKITDRKKDLVKTSGGKYIAPSAIEGSLKAANPLIGQAVVIADGRNFASVLITIDTDAATAWATSNGKDVEAVVTGRDEHVHAEIRTAVETVNGSLNRWETVKEFRILSRELTVESGELTPSLKIKRAVVVRNHAAVIDEIYPNG
jgi:long-chain acyl-CoA synthetase